mmetsp:Transcript_86214/g.244388  ORF Transcript_86214/g.244388 Transcript_86214/m.244388 type:complete len:242 (-) Transcript_86214:92-817(-)
MADANPLDSTFQILKGLHGEIQELRDIVAQESHSRANDVHSIKLQLDIIRKSGDERLARLDAKAEELTAARAASCSKIEASLSALTRSVGDQFTKLEAAADAEARERAQETAALKQLVSSEASQWLARCRAIEKRAKEDRRLSDAACRAAKECHETLQADVHRLEALLSDNSMAKDPFKHFGGKTAAGVGLAAKDETIRCHSSSPGSTQPGSRPLSALTAGSWSARMSARYGHAPGAEIRS